MKQQLIRSNMPALLSKKGYEGKYNTVDTDEYKARLSQWFFQCYNKTLTRKSSSLLADYAEMLEVIRAWMVIYADAKVNESTDDKIIAWYKSVGNNEENIKQCREDLLSKFHELLGLKNKEVIAEQLQELTTSLKNLIIAHGLKPYAVNNVRKKMVERFGEYVPLKVEKIAKIKTVKAEEVQSV